MLKNCGVHSFCKSVLSKAIYHKNVWAGVQANVHGRVTCMLPWSTHCHSNGFQVFKWHIICLCNYNSSVLQKATLEWFKTTLECFMGPTLIIWWSNVYFDRLVIIQWDSGAVTLTFGISNCSLRNYFGKRFHFFQTISCKIPFKIF